MLIDNEALDAAVAAVQKCVDNSSNQFYGFISTRETLVEAIKSYKDAERPIVNLNDLANDAMIACQNFYTTYDGKNPLAVHKHIIKTILDIVGVKYYVD